MHYGVQHAEESKLETVISVLTRGLAETLWNCFTQSHLCAFTSLIQMVSIRYTTFTLRAHYLLQLQEAEQTALNLAACKSGSALFGVQHAENSMFDLYSLDVNMAGHVQSDKLLLKMVSIRCTIYSL